MEPNTSKDGLELFARKLLLLVVVHLGDQHGQSYSLLEKRISDGGQGVIVDFVVEVLDVHAFCLSSNTVEHHSILIINSQIVRRHGFDVKLPNHLQKTSAGCETPRN